MAEIVSQESPPSSPTSVMSSIEIKFGDIISLENFNANTEQGFLYLKNRENNPYTSINSGIALSEFLSYNEDNIERLIQLFCLAVTLLCQTKDKLENIQTNDGRSVYDAIIEKTFDTLGEKLELIT
mgnify:CR=1 FL=1|tara:strand:+ start:200 stop:577 length:378 start_codon:yes stop_codon:yes gene_type:complete